MVWFTDPPPSWMVKGKKAVCIERSWGPISNILVTWHPAFMQTYTITDVHQHMIYGCWGIALEECPIDGWWSVYAQTDGMINWAPVAPVEDEIEDASRAPTTKGLRIKERA